MSKGIIVDDELIFDLTSRYARKYGRIPETNKQAGQWAYEQGRADAIDEFVEYVRQYMWWSAESDEKVIGAFALGEYAIAFKDKLKEKKE